MNHLKWLLLDYQKVVDAANFAGGIGAAYFHEAEENDLNPVIAVTYLRRAGAHFLLLEKKEEARNNFGLAAKLLFRIKSGYASVMEVLSDHNLDFRFDQNSVTAIDDCYSFMNWVAKVPQDSTVSIDKDPFRRSLDRFRGKRMGVLGMQVDLYLNLVDACTNSWFQRNMGEVERAMLPFVEAYSSALLIARQDRYHWERLAMPFHPLEPDILGVLMLARRILDRGNLEGKNFLSKMPIESAIKDILVKNLELN